MLFAFVSCGRYKVDNIENAVEVYDCSRGNMFGLEQVVLFEDSIVVVFDKKTCDKNGKLRLENESNVNVVSGKYIFTKSFEDDYLSRNLCRVHQGCIVFADDGLELFYSSTENFGQIETDYYQTYDRASVKWGPVTEEHIDCNEEYIKQEMALSWT